MTTISVAMATYNGARFIREQLDSLAAQTVLPMELVVTDDGSTDETIAIIEEFAVTAPFPVEVHRNPQRLGYVANFMRCANLCRAELIAFCDQDDIWDLDKLKYVSSCFEETQAHVIFHDFRLIDAEGKNIRTLDESYRYNSIGPWTIVPGLTQTFRRHLLQFSELIEMSVDPGTPSCSLAHDQWIYFLGHSFDSLYHLNHCLLSYRQHDSNTFGLSSGGLEPRSSLYQIVGAVLNALVGDMTLLQAKRMNLHRTVLGRGLSSEKRFKILEIILQGDAYAGVGLLAKHIEYYRNASQAYLSRTAIYEHDLFVGRIACMSSCIRNGSYSCGTRGLKDALLDIIFGVCFRPSEMLKLSKQSH